MELPISIFTLCWDLWEEIPARPGVNGNRSSRSSHLHVDINFDLSFHFRKLKSDEMSRVSLWKWDKDRAQLTGDLTPSDKITARNYLIQSPTKLFSILLLLIKKIEDFPFKKEIRDKLDCEKVQLSIILLRRVKVEQQD